MIQWHTKQPAIRRVSSKAKSRGCGAPKMIAVAQNSSLGLAGRPGGKDNPLDRLQIQRPALPVIKGLSGELSQRREAGHLGSLNSQNPNWHILKRRRDPGDLS